MEGETITLHSKEREAFTRIDGLLLFVNVQKASLSTDGKDGDKKSSNFSCGTIQLCTCSLAGEEMVNRSRATWLYHSDEGGCVCGSSLQNIILCNNISQEVRIVESFCLTSFKNDDNNFVVGRCLYSEFKAEAVVDLYYKLDKNISQQNHKLCGYLNREGRLRGKCKQNHYISAYSYDLKCYKCNRGLISNIILYLTVAYVPLTVFLAIVIIFHISFTTPYLHSVIYLCQCYTSHYSCEC